MQMKAQARRKKKEVTGDINRDTEVTIGNTINSYLQLAGKISKKGELTDEQKKQIKILGHHLGP